MKVRPSAVVARQRCRGRDHSNWEWLRLPEMKVHLDVVWLLQMVIVVVMVVVVMLLLLFVVGSGGYYRVDNDDHHDANTGDNCSVQRRSCR